MTVEKFTIEQGHTFIDFEISANQVSLWIKNRNKTHEPIYVKGSGILPTVLRGLKASAEILFDHELKRHKVTGFDKSQTIEALSHPPGGDPGIMFDKTSGEYRLAGARADRLTILHPEAVPSQFYAEACVTAVRYYNNYVMNKGLNAAIQSSAATFG